MTLADIIAKIKAATEEAPYDPTADIQGLVDESITAVNGKNAELLAKNKALRAITDTLPEDFSIEAYNSALQAAADVDTSKLKVEEQVEVVRKQLTDAHQLDMERVGKQVTGLKSALETELIDNAVTTALTEANGNAKLLLPHVRTSVKVVEEDGTFRAVVVDSSGNERFSTTKAGEKMGIGELVGEFKVNETFAGAFAADNGGGGGGGDDGRGGGPNPFKKGSPDYNLTEQAKMRNSNPELAEQLSKQAASA